MKKRPGVRRSSGGKQTIALGPKGVKPSDSPTVEAAKAGTF
jgi:hypothetical protein